MDVNAEYLDSEGHANLPHELYLYYAMLKELAKLLSTCQRYRREIIGEEVNGTWLVNMNERQVLLTGVTIRWTV